MVCHRRQCSLRRVPFDVRRHNIPIKNLRLKESVDPNISYSEAYAEMDALIAAGASIDELDKWINGGYSPRLLAWVRQWYISNALIKAHAEEASADSAKRKSKARPSRR